MIVFGLALAITIFLATFILSWVVLMDIVTALSAIARSQKEIAASLYIILKILRDVKPSKDLTMDDVLKLLDPK